MRKTILLTTAMFSVITMTATNESVTFRIKGMRCEECAHNVTTVVNKLPGIESMNFDLEKRTVAIEFNTDLTCTDSIKARLDRTGRYKTSVYSKDDVIRRGMGLRMDDMHCQNCADRIIRQLEKLDGIDSLGPHLDKHYFFIRYNANKTCKADIRKALLDIGFTPVSYYTSKDISFAYFNIPKESANDATIDEVLAMDGVDDVNVNARLGSLAITYVNTETTSDKLLQAIQAAGIKATIPAPHECTEEENKK